MISILVSEENIIDADMLLAAVKNAVARQWDEDVEIHCIHDQEDLDAYIEQREKIHAAIVDVAIEDGVAVAKTLRKKYTDIEILIVSDITVSPIVYLNPEVRAASLLLKPLEKGNVDSTIREFLELVDEEDTDEGLEVEYKGAKKRFPYRKIQYFEAKEKRIFVRVDNIEYPLYETMDHLLEQLPKQFLRCHRSYIVNINHIERVRYSENYISLRGDLNVPLSRGYKAEVKEGISAYA